MKKLIGIAAKARSGKDTVATYLWEKYGVTRIAFADPIKVAAQSMFGLTHDQAWNDSLKETVIPYWGLSPRQMLQQLGTDASKPVFGPDIWIKRWAMSYSTLMETDDIVVPDVRCDLEASYLRMLGGVIIHLERPDAQAVSSHISEAGVTVHPEDRYIINNGTLEDLYAKVEIVLGTM